MAKKPPETPKIISLSGAAHAGTHATGKRHVIHARDWISDFLKHGAHLTRHRGSNDPNKPKAIIGQDVTTAPSIDALVTNVERGGLTGIKPSASGLAVVDLDEGGDEGKEAILRILGKPLLAVPSSQPGRWHLYYR